MNVYWTYGGDKTTEHIKQMLYWTVDKLNNQLYISKINFMTQNITHIFQHKSKVQPTPSIAS